MLREYKICFLLPQGDGGAESHLYTSALGRFPVFFLVVLREDSGLIGWGKHFSLPGNLQITPFPAFQER